MHRESSVNLSPDEIAAMFADADFAARFPPVLTVEQAAELLQVPKKTIYDWSSRGLLTSCSRRLGKYLRLLRDRLLVRVFVDGLE